MTLLPRALILSGLASALVFADASLANETLKPNVIVMLADDMGIGDSSAFQDFTGNSDEQQLHTPSMERLARMGVRFTDAHAPSSRCSTTRYALLTGRYAWRSRLKFWVLFGSQGDPLIEKDRPTIASMLRKAGYRTAMVGKWHVGLRYRQTNGKPAAGWEDADLQQPLYDSPLDHGFDVCRITSRSHGTSGPSPKQAKKRTRPANSRKRNGPRQEVGPGHIHGRLAIAATSNGKQLREDGPAAYVLSKLGGRHSDSAIEFLDKHLNASDAPAKPFFLYYAFNANHGPYTPDQSIAGQPVAGHGKSVAGAPRDARGDFIYENDVALGRLLDYLERTDDIRNPNKKLIETTLVLFTSDNGAERDVKTATGPFRSNKGSVYEGGHRVPYIVAWGAGGIGNGDPASPGRTSASLTGLQDIYASLAELAGVAPARFHESQKGGEDSRSAVSLWRHASPVNDQNVNGQIVNDQKANGQNARKDSNNRNKAQPLATRSMFFHDHKQAADPAASAYRVDFPRVGDRPFPGQWKMLFDAALLRRGVANPLELYELSSDPEEKTNVLEKRELAKLVAHLKQQAVLHRNAGGHNLTSLSVHAPIRFDFRQSPNSSERPATSESQSIAAQIEGKSNVTVAKRDLRLTIRGQGAGQSAGQGTGQATFSPNAIGVGLAGGKFLQVDDGQAILLSFDRDVLVESVGVVAGNGQCGGSIQVGERTPLAIYCLDADIDAKDQSGLITDLGVLKAGQAIRLDSRPHLGVESPGRWRLQSLSVRPLSGTR